jgi:hypothetical protein
MSKRERTSGLIGLRPSIPIPTPVEAVVPLDQMEKAFLGATVGTREIPRESTLESAPEVTPAAAPDIPRQVAREVRPDRPPDVRLPILLKKKRKHYTTTFTLRLPIETHKRLKQVAEKHEVGMTEVILAMIDRLLPELEA